MYENQFLQLTSERPTNEGSCIALAVPFTISSGMRIIDSGSQLTMQAIRSISAYSMEHTRIGSVAFTASSSLTYSTYTLNFMGLIDYIKEGECFYLVVTKGTGQLASTEYSNVLKRMNISNVKNEYTIGGDIANGGSGGEVTAGFVYTSTPGNHTIALSVPLIAGSRVISVKENGQDRSFTTEEYESYILIHFHTTMENSQILVKFYMKEGGAYAFKYVDVQTTYIEDLKYWSWLEYKCNETSLGFPGGCMEGVWLPMRIYNPQHSQEDKTYTKRNGEIVTLYASYSKEYEGETDYLPEEWHDKIMAALSCDEVYIDGLRVTKSANYDIKWDSYDETPCGVKLAKATFKVKNHIANRNSNY